MEAAFPGAAGGAESVPPKAGWPQGSPPHPPGMGREDRGAEIVPWEQFVLQLLCGSRHRVLSGGGPSGGTSAHGKRGKGRAAGGWVSVPPSKHVQALGVVLGSGFYQSLHSALDVATAEHFEASN